MSLLDRLRRRATFWAVPQLTLILIVGQIAAFILIKMNPDFLKQIELRPQAVLQGEVWRLITFPFVPAFGDNVLFMILGIMFFHLMGTALEGRFGSLGYNVFLGIAYFSTILCAALSGWALGPQVVVPNMYIFGSVFLAFAYLYPDFEILLMFILPIKVKYLAMVQILLTLLDFVGGLSTFLQGGWFLCLNLLVAHANLIIFFGPEVLQRGRATKRGIERRKEQERIARTPRHTCAVCGATELTHPELDFRYCTKCEGTPAYCEEHLSTHEHRVKQTSS